MSNENKITNCNFKVLFIAKKMVFIVKYCLVMPAISPAYNAHTRETPYESDR